MARLTFQNPGPNKIQVIQVVRRLFNLGLVEAKDLVVQTPGKDTLVIPNLTFARAQEITKALTDVGAVFRIDPYPKKPKPRKSKGATWYERLIEDDDDLHSG